jgi:hypothetical protein
MVDFSVSAVERALIANSNQNRSIIIYDTLEFHEDNIFFINFLENEYKIKNYSVVMHTGIDDLISTYNTQYNLGYRFFISFSGSQTLYNLLIPFFKKNQDAILFNIASTAYFENGVLPPNIIRTSVPDNMLLDYIVNEIMYILDDITVDNSNYNKHIENNTFNKNYKPIFSKIIYIYTEKDLNGDTDLYAENYKTILQKIVKLNDDFTFEFFKIDNENTFSDELKKKLGENPVSSENFIESEKTIFIVNSNTPEKIMNLFDEEYMYDNYFIFGDPFMKKKYTSKYIFNYAIIIIGNYSFDGNKVANIFTDITISPFVYAVYDILFKILPRYDYMVQSHQDVTSLELMNMYINHLKTNNLIIENNYFYDRKMSTYSVYTDDNDETNAQLKKCIFLKSSFNPKFSGFFIEPTHIENIINEDIKNPNSISLLDFGWNSRDTICLYNELDDNSHLPENLFNNKKDLNECIKILEQSVGGNRYNDLIPGNKNHTEAFFEMWRSHDPRLKILEINIQRNAFVNHNEYVYNIKEEIEIDREVFKTAGINEEVPDNNLISIEKDTINIDYEIPLNVNLLILKYFKGTRYKKSFNGLKTDYFGPLLINIKIIPIYVSYKFKKDEFVMISEKNIFGRVIEVSNDFQEIHIQPYTIIYEEYSCGFFVMQNIDALPIIGNQKNTQLYSNSIPIQIIDYTNWSIFKKNIFIRSLFMDELIYSDSKEQKSITYNDYIKKYDTIIFETIKENPSITFSTYANWKKWQNKLLNVDLNTELHTPIFWEMRRSNTLKFIEKSIDIELIMDNNESKIYDISFNVELIPRLYETTQKNNYETLNPVMLFVKFKTSPILPSDIINKPIIFIEYFSGNQYKNSFDGISEKYISPVLINVVIKPKIIYNKYAKNDYVMLNDKKIVCQVISVSDDQTNIELLKYTTLIDENDFIYIKNYKNNFEYNANQNEITPLKNKVIINLNNIGEIANGDYIYERNLYYKIVTDKFDTNIKCYTFFKNFYNAEIVRDIKNLCITFKNVTIFRDWINKINNEILNKTEHTYKFFEISRSHYILLQPIEVVIDYDLSMDFFNPKKYNIIKSVNLTRNIYESINNKTIISSENFNFELNFVTEKIIPSDILSNSIVFVSYYNGNKYLKFNDLQNYYSPLIITINIKPNIINTEIQNPDFVLCDKHIYKIIDNSNYQKLQLEKYAIINSTDDAFYIKGTTQIVKKNANDILSYDKFFEKEIIDLTEWGPFSNPKYFNVLDDINSYISMDSTSFGNINYELFNSRNTIFKGIKQNLSVIMQDENILNNFKKLIISSIFFNKLNHTPLFFEIYRSYNDLLVPLTIEIDYNLSIVDNPFSYTIIKNIPFIRNVYNVVGLNDVIFRENDYLTINIKTPEIKMDGLNDSLFFVQYFKGHKYLTSFGNINEPYLSPLIVKINIIKIKQFYLEN